jgi:hypothetical protein
MEIVAVHVKMKESPLYNILCKVRDDPKLPGDVERYPFLDGVVGGWWFDSRYEIFSLLDEKTS